MSDIGKRIKGRLDELKAGDPSKTQGWLAEEVGVSNNAVSKWIKTGKISRDSAILVAKALGLTLGHLLGEESLAPVILGAKKVAVVDAGDPDFIEIPMVRLRLSAGVTGFQTEPDRRDGGTLGVRRNWIERSGLIPGKLIAINVKGESMEPSLYEGDLVILNTADTQMRDGAVYAINYEGEAVIKRLSRDAGEWWLTSDNPDQRKFHRKLCRSGDCIIVGRVVRKESDRI